MGTAQLTRDQMLEIWFAGCLVFLICLATVSPMHAVVFYGLTVVAVWIAWKSVFMALIWPFVVVIIMFCWFVDYKFPVSDSRKLAE